MSRLRTTLAGAVFAACGLASAAFAAPAYITSGVTLRAGPSGDYPPVVHLRAGTPAEVYGCLDAFTWCDVDADGERGWVKGAKLDIAYAGRRVLLPYYAPRIGLPIVTFSFNDYWGRYYHDRPFFAERERWGRLPVFGVPGIRGPEFRGPDFHGPNFRGPNFRGPDVRTPEIRAPEFHGSGPRPPEYGRPGFPPGGYRAPDDHHEPGAGPGTPGLREPEGGRPGVPGGLPPSGRPEAAPLEHAPPEHNGHDAAGGAPHTLSPGEPGLDHHGASSHAAPAEPPHAASSAPADKDHGHKDNHPPGG